ncbi:FAD-dependent monooxygenase [Streptomyces sp.]|uniref:FAD-dependent monooxygenase n=1 Tax=Streptomyces sp. TaxID=1931 RepID=UPI002F40E4D6
MARIIVVGGGIGGLATALAVTAAGHDTVVLERADRFAEIGAGIQLAPNGIHALDRLGLGEAVRRTAVAMSELRFMDGVTGNWVTSVPLSSAYQRRFRNPYVVVHRAELHKLLVDACLGNARIELHSACETTGYLQDASTVTAVLRDGRHFTGDALIGADGIHSQIRGQMLDDGAPRISGITVYRSVIPMERVPSRFPVRSAVTWWAGPGCHFVHYPIAGGTFLNLAASSDNGATEALTGVAVTKDAVRREFAALCPAARDLLELGEDWKSWVLVDRDPVADWTDGRVAMLGDAAHPMLHYAAQGACQALEDAVLLGDTVDCHADELPQRLEKYNAARRERTSRIQVLARDSVRLWHPRGAGAHARNAMLSAMSAEQLHDHLAWMHGARHFGADAESAAPHGAVAGEGDA